MLTFNLKSKGKIIEGDSLFYSIQQIKITSKLVN